MTYKLTDIIIGTLLVVAVLTGTFMFLSGGIQAYTPNETYDNTSYARLSGVLGNISEQVNQTESELNTVNSEGSVLSQFTDYIGYIFNSGYRAAVIAGKSISGTNTLIDISFQEAKIGEYGTVLKNIVMLILVVVIVIGILLNYIIKPNGGT